MSWKILLVLASLLPLGRLAYVLIARRRRRLDVDGPPSEHWLKGNYHRIFKNGLEYNLNMIEKYGSAFKVHALFGEDQLYVSDPVAIHHILVKEQYIYEETDMFIMGNKLIFGDGLISTLGEQHRKQRKMLNPAFSLANMRDLHPIIQPIADEIASVVLKQLSGGTKAIEYNVLPWLARGALEYASQALIGTTSNVLDPERTSEYALALRQFTPIKREVADDEGYKRPHHDQANDSLKDMARIVEVMDRHSRRIFQEKQAELASLSDSKGVEKKPNVDDDKKGKDIMSLMMKANAASDDSDKLTEQELLGQISTILLAASETTPSAISRMLWLLANKPDVQTRLRQEIRATKQQHASETGLSPEGWEDVKLSYDTLMSMPYLDAVVREMLRVYPPTCILSRTTRQATVLPLHRPVRNESGVPITAIPLQKDTTVIVSLLGANYNKEIWGPDASEWNPERWLTGTPPGTSPEGIKYPGVYASMMTFLAGGRACIGFKFAEMEIKQVLVTLLSRMKFSIPIGVDGKKKDIHWRVNAFQVPVVRPPSGDDQTPQVLLEIRLAREDDFA